MTTYTSNDVLPAVIRYLLAKFDDDRRFHDVTVTYGPARDIDRDHIFIGDTVDQDEITWATLGKRSSGATVDFDSNFSITCSVAGVGNSPQEAFERASELRGFVEDLIRTEGDRPNSGETVGAYDLPRELAVRTLIGRLRHQFIQETEGVGCDAGLVVRIQARI